jgi:lycopene cyclase domain-containing protein
MDRVFTVYLLLLIPFFIVNGILTGTGLEEPVVWYNDEENLGIRLLTIPVEDVVYGFELFLLTVFFFEKIDPLFHLNRQSSLRKKFSGQ